MASDDLSIQAVIGLDDVYLQTRRRLLQIPGYAEAADYAAYHGDALVRSPAHRIRIDHVAVF
jgi:hypothetical protein